MDRRKGEMKPLLSGRAWTDRCFVSSLDQTEEAVLLMTIQQRPRWWLVIGSWKHTGQRFSKEMGEGQGRRRLDTDLCQVWCRLGWRRQRAPDWASVHRAFRTVWACPRGSGCRCHDRQSNPRGTTLEVQGYDYLQQHGLDLSQYLLKIQLQGFWFRTWATSYGVGLWNFFGSSWHILFLTVCLLLLMFLFIFAQEAIWKPLSEVKPHPWAFFWCFKNPTDNLQICKILQDIWSCDGDPKMKCEKMRHDITAGKMGVLENVKFVTWQESSLFIERYEYECERLPLFCIIGNPLERKPKHNDCW